MAESLRESLSASFDKTDSAPAPDTPVSAPDTSAPSAAPASAPETGKPAASIPPSQRTTSETPAEARTESKLPPEPGAAPLSESAAPQAPAELRAPPSWKPEIREHWAKLPPEVQAEVVRREREVARALNSSADARRQVAEMARLAAPYQQYIAMEGGDPMKAYGDYLRSAALLRGGTPAQKASAVANVVQQFGVDLRLLDNELIRALGGQPQQLAQQPQEFRDPRVDQMLYEREQARKQQEEAITAAASEDIQAFAADPQNEFIYDVKDDMSDILAMNANRNRKVSLKEAYDRACAMNPEIAKVIDQRRIASQAKQQQGVLDSKRRAAVGLSDSGGRANGADSGHTPSLRSALEESINLHSRQ